MTSSTDSITRITRLLSDAQQFIRNANSGPEISREYWIEKAKDCAFEASLVAIDYKAPTHKIPEWGTHGT
jgi:hypothetical protein